VDRYHITLFIHLLTLIAAGIASAIINLALGRRARARTVGEMLDWHRVLESSAKVFPIALASFAITGGYMLNLSQIPMLSTPFAVAGLVGVAWLLVTGIFLGVKGRGLRAMLEEMAKKGLDQPAPTLVPPPFIAALPTVNPAIAVAVAFDMTTKPSSMTVAFGILAIGLVVGAAMWMRRPAPVPIPISLDAYEGDA
jgi:hypothetical protein